MTTLIINQETGEAFSLTSPLLDPERMDNDQLEENDQIFFSNQAAAAVAANVYESHEAYEVRLLAPGLDGSNITIDVDDNNILTVNGDLEEEDFPELENCKRLEFATNGFSRSFQLPDDADAEEITADYKNGIVRLIIPKEEMDRGQIIEIIET